MGEGHSRSPAPCQAKECGSYSRAPGKSQDNVVDVTRGTGAECEMLGCSQAGKGDPEEGTAGTRPRGGIETHPLGVLRAMGSPWQLVALSPPWPPSLPQFCPFPTLQPHQPSRSPPCRTSNTCEFPGLCPACAYSWATLPLVVPHSPLLILRPSA